MNISARENRRYALGALFILTLCTYLFAWYMERLDLRGLPPEWLLPIYPQLIALPQPVQTAVFFLLELLHPRVWRHMLPLVLAWYFAQQATISLVQNLFDLNDPNTAAQFLARLHKPDNPPGTAVRINRQTFAKDRWQSPLLRHGGPGIISIAHGDSVITERNGRYEQVLGPGNQRLRQYEYVRSVLDCRPQERLRMALSAHTQDGIELRTDMTLVYHIGRGDQQPEAANPYPFSAGAAYNAAYAEVILPDGHIDDWEARAVETAESKLREVIGKFTLDRLLFRINPELKPHEFVQEKVEQEVARALRYIGVELVEIRLGRLIAPDEVTRQRIAYWQTFWEHRQQEDELADEAVFQIQMEAAKSRAKAQAIAQLVAVLQQTAQQTIQLGQPKALLVWRLMDEMEQMVVDTAESNNLDNDTAGQLHQRLDNIRQQLQLASGQDTG
ncbi:MAG: SPFH domain-containing protein [Anaerolineales bacterium]|nr:SPFH domain-containing protein [Anaerolineales bacterium]